MRGRHSEVGKVGLGPYIRGRDDSCVKKGYTSPLNSPPLRAGSQFEKSGGVDSPILGIYI
jgi:hypothetical protein